MWTYQMGNFVELHTSYTGKPPDDYDLLEYKSAVIIARGDDVQEPE